MGGMDSQLEGTDTGTWPKLALMAAGADKEISRDLVGVHGGALQ